MLRIFLRVCWSVRLVCSDVILFDLVKEKCCLGVDIITKLSLETWEKDGASLYTLSLSRPYWSWVLSLLFYRQDPLIESQSGELRLQWLTHEENLVLKEWSVLINLHLHFELTKGHSLQNESWKKFQTFINTFLARNNSLVAGTLIFTTDRSNMIQRLI